MYVDWEYYKIFYYVAKYQNFTKAARVLGNNQPNITHSMNRLESQLNCVLFIRSNRGVTLTPEGEMLYSRIASAAVQIQDAEEELSASATLEHGTISISATETALNIYLSEKLRAFHNNFPGIRLRISNHSTPQAVQAVKNGEVDFAIVSTPAEVDPGLKMVELKSFYEVLVGGKTFTALASQNLSLKELTNYPLISLSDEMIREAAKKNKWLHIFILSEEQSFLTTRERYQLVKEGIQEIPNVILHQTSEYMISPAVFPTYFIKEKAKAYEMNCQLDIQLFGERIAPELNITDRYVGSEPACDVTHTYNQCLREQLPCYQIRFHEIPRKTYGDQIISASEVRKRYAENQLKSVCGMLPESTWRYLERKKNENGK